MPYRRLSNSELETLVREHTAFRFWREYVSFATDMYGRNAERINVRIGSEYNDESFSPIVEAIDVYDARGSLLEVDLATDWWQSLLNTYDPDDYEEDLISDALDERRVGLPLLPLDQVFFVSCPPTRTHAAVYVTEE